MLQIFILGHVKQGTIMVSFGYTQKKMQIFYKWQKNKNPPISMKFGDILGKISLRKSQIFIKMF